MRQSNTSGQIRTTVVVTTVVVQFLLNLSPIKCIYELLSPSPWNSSRQPQVRKREEEAGRGGGGGGGGLGPMCSCYLFAPPLDVFLSDAFLPINFRREISFYFYNISLSLSFSLFTWPKLSLIQPVLGAALMN